MAQNIIFSSMANYKKFNLETDKKKDESTTLKAEHIVRTRVQKNTPDETENRFTLKEKAGIKCFETAHLIVVLPATCQSLRLPRTSCSIHLHEF